MFDVEQVQVKRNGDDEKFMAEVLAIGNECDLALLTVRNEAFWQGAKLLKLGSLPRLKVLLPRTKRFSAEDKS